MMFFILQAVFAIASCNGLVVDDNNNSCSGFLHDLGIEDIGNLNAVSFPSLTP